MDASTLCKAMPGLAPARAAQLIDGCNDALTRIDATTVQRAAMFLAQIGEETGSLTAATEYASGAEYNGRVDLGNTQPGDGEKYKGRGYIQVTGRSNYAALSTWAHSHGDVPTATYFLDNPAELATDQYVWLGAIWYWLQKHARDTTKWQYLNDAADHGDVIGATYIINGGQNGIADRTSRYQHCLTLGDALLPDTDPMEEIMAYYKDRADFETAMSKIVKAQFKAYFSNFFLGGGAARRMETIVAHVVKGTAYPKVKK